MNVSGLILAGGKGKRFRKISLSIPKVLFPIGGQSVIEYSFDLFRASKFVKEVIVNVGYASEKIISHIAHNDYPFPIITSKQMEYTVLNAVLIALTHTNYDTIVLVSGDEIRPGINLDNALKEHFASGATATVIGVRNKQMAYHNLLKCDQQSKVVKYLPAPQQYSTDILKNMYIHSGILIFNKGVEKTFKLHGDGWLSITLPLIEEKIMQLYFAKKGNYFDIGTEKGYKISNSAIKKPSNS